MHLKAIYTSQFLIIGKMYTTSNVAPYLHGYDFEITSKGVQNTHTGLSVHSLQVGYH